MTYSESSMTDSIGPRLVFMIVFVFFCGIVLLLSVVFSSLRICNRMAADYSRQEQLHAGKNTVAASGLIHVLNRIKKLAPPENQPEEGALRPLIREQEAAILRLLKNSGGTGGSRFTARLARRIQRSGTLILAASLGVWLMAAVMVYLIIRICVRKPAQALAEAAGRVGNVQTDTPVEIRVSGEWNRLKTVLNALHRRMRRQEGLLEKKLRKTREESAALISSERTFREIFERSPLGVFRSTLDHGRYLLANPAMAKILGYEHPDDLFRYVDNIRNQIFTEPESRDRLLRMLDEYGDVDGFETRFYRKNGEQIWVSIKARGLKEQNGRMFCVEGIVEDISDRKASENYEREYRVKMEKELKAMHVSPAVFAGGGAGVGNEAAGMPSQ